MTGSTLTIIAGLVFAPLAASAQSGNANAALSGQMQALRASGFLGLAEIQVPQATADVKATPASVQVDETAEALAALSREVKEESSQDGETARALGFNFNGDLLPTKYIVTPKVQDVTRFFSITTFRGTADIIIQEIRKVDGRKELRSYLITSTGSLEAAALTVKINGKVQAERISGSQAQAGCRELLEFWTRYYRDNLKKP